MNILQMGSEELLKLEPDSVNQKLSKDELLHIFWELGGLWLYDYNAVDEGRPGMHALLKSGRHSDGFLNSHEVLKYDNIRKIIAKQLDAVASKVIAQKPNYIAGIPRGATKLGEDVAQIMGVRVAEMVKERDGIKLVSEIEPGKTILLVEDFCTRGTGFKQAVTDIVTKYPSVEVLRYELVIINRGGLSYIDVENVDPFPILALVYHRIQDWAPEECPLCAKGSEAIKPKETEESWDRIRSSQKP